MEPTGRGEASAPAITVGTAVEVLQGLVEEHQELRARHARLVEEHAELSERRDVVLDALRTLREAVAAPDRLHPGSRTGDPRHD